MIEAHQVPPSADELMAGIERELRMMHVFLRPLPAPCLLYGADGTVLWCNRTMLNLFWATEIEAKYRPLSSVEGRHVSEAMPEYLWPYVLEQNARVLRTKKSQYEDWSDEQWVGVKWRCLRFPADDGTVGVILMPENEEYLEIIDAALLAH
jgi:PAS domain-containing protein